MLRQTGSPSAISSWSFFSTCTAVTSESEVASRAATEARRPPPTGEATTHLPIHYGKEVIELVRASIRLVACGRAEFREGEPGHDHTTGRGQANVDLAGGGEQVDCVR